MIAALRFEFVRLTTLKSTFMIVLAVIVVNAVLPVLLTALADGPMSSTRAASLVVGGMGIVPELPPVAAMIIGLLGAFSIGHDYRYGTIRPTLLAIPRRGIVIGAKALALVVTALSIAVLSLLINIGLVALIGQEAVPLGGQTSVIMGYLLLMVGWALLGLASALVFRQTLGAIAFMFGGAVIVETILRTLTLIPALEKFKPAMRFLPYAAGNALAQDADGKLAIGIDPLSKPQYAAIFVTFIVIMTVIGWVRFMRNDA